MQPLRSDADLGNRYKPIRKPRPLTCGTCNEIVRKGEELYLTYGTHPNHTLLAEYGFINDVSEEDIICGRCPGEVKVEDMVKNLFQSRGALGTWMK